MAFGQFFDFAPRQVFEHILKALVFAVIARAVEFEILKQKQQLFEMIHGQAVINGIEGVGNDAHDVLILQVLSQIEDIGAQPLNLRVMRFGDVQGQYVDLTAIIRKVGGDFFTDESPRKMGDFQCSVDDVMVADRHMSHAAASGKLINIQRLGEAFRASDFFKNPLARSFGVL